MSLIEDLKKEIQGITEDSNIFELAIIRTRFLSEVLSGKYGTEIMLDYLGGDSVEFVRKQQEKGMGKP